MESTGLMEFLGRGLILLAVATLIGWRMHDARAACRFWCGVFILLLVMAVVGLGPAWQWVDLGVKPQDGSAATIIGSTSVETGAGRSVAIRAEAPVAAPPVESWATSWSIDRLLGWLWVGGVGFGFLRLAASRWSLARLVKKARPLRTGGVTVLESDAISAPLSFGILRPGIVVPAGFSEWPQQERRMALRHEHCHLAGRDNLWQWLASVMAIVHWPNPLAWLAVRRLEHNRELAVDAEVLCGGVSRAAYSELLVRLASGDSRQGRETSELAAVAMARKSTIPLRVDRILRGSESGKVAVGPLLWLALGFLGGVALTLGVTSLGNQKSASGEDSAGAEVTSELFTHVYTVPPNFVPTVADGASIGDPFAADSEDKPRPRRPLKEWLTEVGISFPEGSSAVYDPSKSQIIIRNTIENMELVEALIESLVGESQRLAQVYVTTKVIEGQSGFAGMDWLVPDAEKGKVAGVFTDPQFQMVVRTLNQQKGVDLWQAPSIMIRNGQKGRVEIMDQPEVRDFLLEATPLVGSDGFTLDLSLQVGPDVERGAFSITLWDGQTVAWTEPVAGGRVRATFVTVRLMDPAGLPVHPEPSAIPPASNISISDLEP